MSGLFDPLLQLFSITNSAESRRDDADWQCILPRKDNRAYNAKVHEELFRMALAPVDLMRRLQREQEITEAFDFYENNDDGMSWMEEDARAQHAAIEFVSVSDAVSATNAVFNQRS
ncbi:uncharacterized protein LAESUDRAFT_728482 [Laetiporus sulphureus 93-53]|uniref:Uncharacterized protein n=1 Tax=Laetiporus sulphureus 93-53 TaxID=1314785 RepID=A0A165D6C3_9APHY|nr:uncharacterized protein LAESUDRAFT_728482 [Laetiporus sulphureus 93-53]KZT04234.1 hypothetical protein LAESUDRAFT_728482 [Laetiporus sulphureus 93-53]